MDIMKLNNYVVSEFPFSGYFRAFQTYYSSPCQRTISGLSCTATQILKSAEFVLVFRSLQPVYTPWGVPRGPRYEKQFWYSIVPNYAFNCHSCYIKIKYCSTWADVWLRSIRHYPTFSVLLRGSMQFSAPHPHHQFSRRGTTRTNIDCVQQRPMEPAQAVALLLRIQRSRLQSTDSAPNWTIYRSVFRRCLVRILAVFVPPGKCRNSALTCDERFVLKNSRVTRNYKPA
jgi:hypothetical protein